MERTYKITIRTEQDVRSLFPSERRYSASTVLGISVVFIALTVTSVLMGSLIIHKSNTFDLNHTDYILSENHLGLIDHNSNVDNYTKRYKELERKVTLDLNEIGGHELGSLSDNKSIDRISRIYTSLAVAAFLMSLGTATAAVSGLLAWKFWYIDHYIFIFFLSCVFSTATSAVSFVLICIILFDTSYADGYEGLYSYHLEVFSRGIAVNTVICMVIALIWSGVATKISYQGMINSYPDDANLPKPGNEIQVTTKVKGNKSAKMITPDILNHFPVTGKIAKFLPKKENKNLPNSESSLEYNDRVNQFLSDFADVTPVHKSGIGNQGIS